MKSFLKPNFASALNIKFHSTVSKAFLKSKNRISPDPLVPSIKSITSFICRILQPINLFCIKPCWLQFINVGKTVCNLCEL